MSDEYDLNDVVGFAASRQPADFQQAVNDVLQAKAVEAIESMKQGVAQSMFGSDDEDDDIDWDSDDEDIEVDEEDDDWDSDEDLDDLDLDIDLEGLEDDE